MRCCFCVKIRTGCFVGAMAFVMLAFVKIILCIVFPLPEEPETIIILNILLIFIAGTLLLIGTIMEDRICIITFICFAICAIVIQGVGLLVVYVTRDQAKMPAPFVVVLVLEHAPYLYMIPISILEFRILKEKHLRIAESYGPTSTHISHTSALVPGVGF